ncbi:hypothetical protein ABT56_19075 [Photobacterium aquae]|uniref:VWFA domain-containing protein n=1 Tax=Photobacterium aquae TaxID=1195763 RepID=A0A0J1JMZ0_9GAMM|nr:VWA domain-containing protein [Photobacterium aquae]KLV03532.1 hypothetical protein ABT56_19075 [Photobacterium aquae]
MSKNSSIFKRSMPIIAAGLSAKFNIRVNVSGSEAYTNGAVINVPDYDLDTQEDKHVMQGYLVHEVGHNRYNSFDIDPNTKPNTPIAHTLWNCIEDIRIEMALMQEFAGTKIWLNMLAQRLYDTRKIRGFTNTDHPSTIFVFYALYYGRFKYLSQKAYGLVLPECEKAFLQTFNQHILNRMKGVLSQVDELNSSQDSVDMTLALLKMLNDEKEKSESNQQDDSGADQGNGPSDAQDDSDEGLADRIAITLDANASDIADLGDVKSVLDDFTTNAACNVTTALSETNYRSTPEAGKKLNASVKMTANGLIGRMMGMMQTKRRVVCRDNDHGRLNTRVLHRSVRGDRNIFRSEGKRKTIDTCVVLMLDISGSMNNNVSGISKTRFEIARDTVIALTLALERCKIKTIVTVYPYKNLYTCGLLKKENENAERVLAERMVNITPDGQTPIAMAYYHSVCELIKSKCKRKIIFSITDGEPTIGNATPTREYIQEAKKEMVESYGIGIGKDIEHHSMTHIYGKNYVVIDDLKNLKSDLFKMIEKVID